ncbi:hypothetical protein BH09MYX1_BH09MYX1_64430 [soil metagenome]
MRAELVSGSIVVAPSPTPAHQDIAGAIYAEYRGPFHRGRGGPGGWWLIGDVDVEFGPKDVFRPDIAGWRKERVPSFPVTRPVTPVPDWVCEVLSPGSAAMDQGEKQRTYHTSGVRWYWVVDPHHRTITVLERSDRAYVVERTVGDRGLVGLPPFDALEIDLADFFP